MRGWRGGLSKVLVSDDVLGVEEPAWREVHPGVTVRQVNDESVVVWARPYPGHPGGFVVQDHIRQDVDRYARALSDLFDLFDSEAIAYQEFDLPHVEAFPYLVRVVDLATRVLVQRLPGELEDYLEHPGHAGTHRLGPSSVRLGSELPPSTLTDGEARALFRKNQRNRPVTRIGVAEKARLSLSGKAPRASEPEPERCPSAPMLEGFSGPRPTEAMPQKPEPGLTPVPPHMMQQPGTDAEDSLAAEESMPVTPAVPDCPPTESKGV